MLKDLIKPRISELGSIKIGGLGKEMPTKKGGTFRLPVKYDHFEIVSKVRDGKGDFTVDDYLMSQLTKEHGDKDGKLRQIPIALLSNDIEEVLLARYCWYNGKKLAAASDGVTLWKHYDKKTNTFLDTPEESQWKPELLDWKDDKGNSYFKLHTTLNCVIAARESRWGGYYKFRTTSQISSSQLYGSLLHLKELTGGLLRGIPLRLVLRPMQVAPNGKTTTVYVVHVELIGGDLQAIQQMAIQRIQFESQNRQAIAESGREYRQAIAAPSIESEKEQEEIQQEFHPEEQPEPAAPGVDPLATQLGLVPGEVPNEDPALSEEHADPNGEPPEGTEVTK